MAGPRQKIGEAIGDWISGMMPKADRDAEGVAGPEAAPEPDPIQEQTGAPPPPPMTQQQMDDSIQQLGHQGELGPLEAAELYGRAGQRRNINLDFFEDEQTRETMEYFNRMNDGYNENPARVPKSHDETIAKSVQGAQNRKELTQRIERITGGSINDKWETEDLVGIYQLMEAQASELILHAKELKAARTAGVEPSKEDLAHYQLMSSRFVALQEIASVRAAEAGRMLNALQAVSKSGGSEYFRDIEGIVTAAGGDKAVWASIDRMTMAGDLKSAAASARKSWWTKRGEELTHIRYNFMLSNPTTHMANITGSLFTGLWESTVANTAKVLNNNIEYVARASLNKAFGTPAMQAQDRIALSEIVSLPFHTVASIRDGFREFKGVMKGETRGRGKVYNEMGVRETQVPFIGEVSNRVLSTPTQALEAEDAFFRNTYEMGKLRQLAHRKALQNAESNEDVGRLFNNYLKSPPPEMLKEASDFGRQLTFTNDPSYYGNILGGLGRLGKGAQQFTVGRWLFPFVQTPTNLLGYSLDATGLGKMVGLDKFKADLQNPETRADAIARLEIAAGLYVYLHSHWEEGNITGAAPDNYGILRAREQAGWRPNSIRIGDEYHQLNRIDPLGMILATYATMYEAEAAMGDATQSPDALLAGIVNTVTMLGDRSFLAGLGDLERIISASEGSVGKMTGKAGARIATSFVLPAIMRVPREMDDPYVRSLDSTDTVGGAFWGTFTKAYKNAVPGMSGSVPPAVDAFGDDKLNIGGMFYRGLLPVKGGSIEDSPEAAALLATSTPINKPDYIIKHPKIPNAPGIDILQMDDGAGWMYREYQIMVGKRRQEFVSRLLENPNFQKQAELGNIGPDTPMGDKLMEMVRKGRRIATAEFIERFDGQTTFTPMVGGEAVVGEIEISMPIYMGDYTDLVRALREEGPTLEIRQQAEDQGLKIQHKAEQRGLPPEMRF